MARRLLYVPIIHTEADLGSVGEDIAKRGLREFGETLWKRHQETVLGFWDAIAGYFDSIEVSGFKVFQDGMVADGETGMTIVQEVVKTGSRNYQIISELIRKGAILVKTEDINLVREERDWILRITQAKNRAQKLDAALKYKLAKNNLLEKRDKFIAKQIDDTLQEGGMGILFVGAFHNVRKWLQKEIAVKEIKDIHKVKEYHKLLPFYRSNRERVERLRMYLMDTCER
ncbi:MAG: hypothetical protein C0399_11475 [Syntrophus sp. (in: bacteria)]|nr:hypothetical protein [Syntrophus sp. (in: bacteria)]MBA4418915.1 hypothetical protein [Syntrophus sp. (in: bacteria)]